MTADTVAKLGAKADELKKLRMQQLVRRHVKQEADTSADDLISLVRDNLDAYTVSRRDEVLAHALFVPAMSSLLKMKRDDESGEVTMPEYLQHLVQLNNAAQGGDVVLGAPTTTAALKHVCLVLSYINEFKLASISHDLVDTITWLTKPVATHHDRNGNFAE